MDEIDRRYSHLRRDSRERLKALAADGAPDPEVAEHAEALAIVDDAKRRIRERGLTVPPDPGG